MLKYCESNLCEFPDNIWDEQLSSGLLIKCLRLFVLRRAPEALSDELQYACIQHYLSLRTM